MKKAVFELQWMSDVLQAAGQLEKKVLPAGTPGAARDAGEGFERITTDSRKAAAGDLFVAIPGEKFDGHAFIEAALKQGARGILCETSKMGALEALSGRHPEVTFFCVRDVQAAYRALGAAWRRRFEIPVIVVAGSNGKTTTKEFLAALLRGRHSQGSGVLKTLGSQNGFLGIPMTLLDLRDHHGAAVIEVGIDDVGAMAQHIECVSPTQALLTVIGPEHLENLKDVATVAREELIALSETSRRGGKLAIHLDDPWIAASLGHEVDPSHGLTFSLEKPADVMGRLVVEGATPALEVRVSGESPVRLALPLPGRHNAQNLLAAVTMARLVGLSLEEIERGLTTFEGAEGRSQIKPFGKNMLAICDYYNASPVSMQAAFELLASTGIPEARRWACLADMKELGENELRFHRELAPLLLSAKPAGIFLHGPRMVSLLDELRKLGFGGILEHHDSPEAVARSLKPRLNPGDVVLIKGSRSMKMEAAWEALRL